MAKQRVLKFTASCSDRFNATLKEEGHVETEYDGYVPTDLGIGGGDYVRLEIDLETGQILNWVKPTDETLEELGLI